MMDKIFGGLWAAMLIGIVLLVAHTVIRVADAQQQILIQLGDVAGATQTQRAATLGNFATSLTLTSRPILGAQLAEKASRWTVVSAPAGGSQATASIAAEAAVRHVADCVMFAADSTAMIAAGVASQVNLRDGASGAGTVIAAFAVAEITAGAAGVQLTPPTALCGLNLVGTTNTAMTLEFTAALAGAAQSVTITGYNIQ